MKKTKLDLRYKAKRRWGYNYSLDFQSREWKSYFAVKSRAEEMFGPSVDTTRRFLFKDDAALLKTGAWAYKYTRSRDPSVLYFRKEKDLDHVLMMYGLTYTG